MAIPVDEGSGETPGAGEGTSGSESSGRDPSERPDKGSSRADFDSLGEGDSERSCRATGGDDLSDLIDRATGPTSRSGDVDRESPISAGSGGASFNLLGDRSDEPRFHLSDDLHGPQESPFSLGDFDLSERAQPGERASEWGSKDGYDPLRGYSNALETMADFIGGVKDFLKNRNEMVALGRKGAGDKFYHCMANCEATQRGPGGEAAAEIMSTIREYPYGAFKNTVVDGMSWEASQKDIREDMAANRFGREAARAGERCLDACRPFDVRNKRGF
jgi:hypothetical protein